MSTNMDVQDVVMVSSKRLVFICLLFNMAIRIAHVVTGIIGVPTHNV